MFRSALAKDFSGILEAVAWLQLLRGAFARAFFAAFSASLRLRRRLLRHSGRFPRAFLVASESNVRH